MPRICISLTSSSTMSHVPLAALGYALRRAEVLQPLTEVALPMKTVTHTPGDKLMEALVLILAGGRATAQADVLLRPNRGLARAWGQDQFAQQSTLSQALDAFEEVSLLHLQSAFETMTRTWSRACHHDFRRGGLTLDGDLTGLPASRHAEGSTKGYFAGKKIATGVNWRESRCSPTAKRWGRCSIRALKKASIACSPWCS